MRTRRFTVALGSRALAGLLRVAGGLPFARAALQRRARATLEQGELLFVCHGNLNRSAFAAALARRRWPERRVGEAGSSATPGQCSAPEAVAAAARWEVNLAAHRATQLSQELVDGFSALYVFDARNVVEVALSHPMALPRVHLVGWLAEGGDPIIPDPHGGTAAAYESAFASIALALGVQPPG